MVYYGADGWQFDKAQFIYDNAERYGAYGDQQGVLSPGYKQRSLTLSALDSDDYGYVLVQILTREEDKLTVQSSPGDLRSPRQRRSPAGDSLARGLLPPGGAGAEHGSASPVPL